MGRIAGLVILGVLSLPFLQGFFEARGEARYEALPKVDVTFTSDPTGAHLWIDGLSKGQTPITVDLPQNQEVEYELIATEPYDDYDLYKGFSGTVTPAKDEAVSVWLERTTAEEQAAQREEVEQARARRAEEVEQAQREAEIEAMRLYYRIETNCPSGVNITYTNVNGDTTQDNNQTAAWYYGFVPHSGQFLYLSAQNRCDYGKVTVKFVQDGVTVKENTSSGGYVIATVSGQW